MTYSNPQAPKDQQGQQQTKPGQLQQDAGKQQQQAGQQQQQAGQQQQKPGQQQQNPAKNDGAERNLRTPNMPGSQGIESPGRDEVGRSKPGEEQGMDANRKGRAAAGAEDATDDSDDNTTGPGGSSGAKRDTGARTSGSTYTPNPTTPTTPGQK